MTQSDSLTEILEEWLDDAEATSSMGVTIDDNRTEDDRDRQYLEALEKAKQSLMNWHLQKCRSYLPNNRYCEYDHDLNHKFMGCTDCQVNQAIDTITKRIEGDK